MDDNSYATFARDRIGEAIGYNYYVNNRIVAHQCFKHGMFHKRSTCPVCLNAPYGFAGIPPVLRRGVGHD